MTGLRIGEILALSWGRINLAAGTLRGEETAYNLRSSQSPGRKFRHLFVRHGVSDLDGIATHFAIFNVSLLANG